AGNPRQHRRRGRGLPSPRTLPPLADRVRRDSRRRHPRRAPQARVPRVPPLRRAALARERRVAVHLHTAGKGNFWRDLPYMLATIAAGRPLLLQLHGAGFERFYDGCDTAARALIRWVLERAGAVIVATDSRRSWVRSICRNANAVAVPNPVEPIQSAGAPAQRNIILF